ncbi:hypothetical protein UCRNP2_1849 [Neofusicoccum parvum UCRNP2]|uniref:Uncharacterized protein n=1 Tax=Botryosphaeria parva (strain UCR-NP2) TaxID=1287680 RepID=R1EU95_BOTPV|nr:hypothetical protein UCRNP2_1849 [Neofusicoccum parvum UCRNP2]
MSFSQPPAQDTSLTGDWSPSLDRGSTPPTNEVPNVEEQWILETLNNIPNDDFMVDGQPLATIDTDLALPHQEFFLDNDPFNTIQEQQNEAFNGFAPSTTDLFGTFQPDSMAGATMPWASAPFGADQWGGLPQMVDQPMAGMAQAWETPFEGLAGPSSSTQIAVPGAGDASTPASAG